MFPFANRQCVCLKEKWDYLQPFRMFTNGKLLKNGATMKENLFSTRCARLKLEISFKGRTETKTISGRKMNAGKSHSLIYLDCKFKVSRHFTNQKITTVFSRTYFS